MPETENQSPDVLTSDKTAEGERHPDESELVEFVEALWDEADKATDDAAKPDKWDEWERVFWGEQWPEILPTFKAPIVANEMQTLILAEVSDLTDSPLTVYVQKDPSQGARDTQVEQAIQAYWRSHQVDLTVMGATLNAAKFPCGFVSCTWDTLANRGMGEIDVSVRDSRSVKPDPDCVDDEHWRYCFLTDVLDLLDVQTRYVDHGARVRPDDRLSLKLGQKTGRATSGRYKGPLYHPGIITHEGYAKPRTEVKTLFIGDEATQEELIEKKDLDGSIIGLASSKKKKYPHGRMLVVAGDVVLYDGPSYRGRWPVVRVHLTPCPNEFWPGNSMVGGVVELQKAANKLESMVVENGLRMNAGYLIADADSGIDPKTFAATPGQILLKKPQSTVDFKFCQQMPDSITNSGKRLRETMREVMGFQPSRMGTGSRGNVAAELTETEISQSMGVSRLRGRLLHAAVQKVVQMVFERMAQFYTTPRAIPVLGGKTGFATVPWQPMDATLAERYAVHVDPAAFQVKSKTMLQRLYLALAKMGKIPNEDLLKMLEIPDAQEVANRLKEDLMLQALAKGHAGKGKNKSTQF